MQPVQLLLSSFIALSIVATLGCHRSKDNREPSNPPNGTNEEGPLTENIKDCIRKEFAGTTALNISPYDAVIAYQKCGGPDDSKVFSTAAEELFNVQNVKNLSLK